LEEEEHHQEGEAAEDGGGHDLGVVDAVGALHGARPTGMVITRVPVKTMNGHRKKFHAQTRAKIATAEWPWRVPLSRARRRAG
jgi:hypothetical protein